MGPLLRRRRQQAGRGRGRLHPRGDRPRGRRPGPRRRPVPRRGRAGARPGPAPALHRARGRRPSGHGGPGRAWASGRKTRDFHDGPTTCVARFPGLRRLARVVPGTRSESSMHRRLGLARRRCSSLLLLVPLPVLAPAVSLPATPTVAAHAAAASFATPDHRRDRAGHPGLLDRHRPRLRRRPADLLDDRGHQRLPQRLRPRPGRHRRGHRHQQDALRPDPECLPVGLGAEDQPRPGRPEDRRHRHPRGVLLPAGPDLLHRLRVRRRRGDPDPIPVAVVRTTTPTTPTRSARPAPSWSRRCTRSSPPATPRSPTTPSGTPSSRPTRIPPTAAT